MHLHFVEIELVFLSIIRKTWKNFLAEKFLVAYVKSRSNIIKWYFNYIQQQEKNRAVIYDKLTF